MKNNVFKAALIVSLTCAPFISLASEEKGAVADNYLAFSLGERSFRAKIAQSPAKRWEHVFSPDGNRYKLSVIRSTEKLDETNVLRIELVEQYIEYDETGKERVKNKGLEFVGAAYRCTETEGENKGKLSGIFWYTRWNAWDPERKVRDERIGSAKNPTEICSMLTKFSLKKE